MFGGISVAVVVVVSSSSNSGSSSSSIDSRVVVTTCAIKIEGKNRGGEGTTPPVTTACPEAGK